MPGYSLNVLLAHFRLTRRAHCGNVGLGMNINTAICRLPTNWRKEWRRFILTVRSFVVFIKRHANSDNSLDPPLKRFAQRQMYLGIDAIADRDLGFALARRAHREGSSTQQVLQPSASITMKRAASPDHSRKARAEEPLHKKARQKSPMQPPPPREKERDRDWSRDRERDRPPPPPRRGRFSPPPPVGRGRDMERGRPGPSIDQRPPPAVLVNFLGRLPSSRQFDGMLILLSLSCIALTSLI